MSTLTLHKFVGSLPNTLEPNGIYFIKNGLFFDIVVTNESGTIIPHSLIRPKVFNERPIVTNQQSIANGFTAVLTKALPFDVDGNYMLTLSFNFNSDATNSDLIVRATLDGQAMDLNNRDADPQGQYQILRQESKDSVNGPGGAITGTGSGQKYAYSMQFVLSAQTAGNKTLQIDIGSEAVDVESSMWNITGKLELCEII